MAKSRVAVRGPRLAVEMSDLVNSSIPANLTKRQHGSPWAPLREPLFRSLWVAAVISYTGTWMQNVGAGWLMTQLTMSPLMVSLVQAAAMLPVFLVILPAGALADMVNTAATLAHHTRMDGGGGGGAGNHESDPHCDAVGAAGVHISAGNWGGDE